MDLYGFIYLNMAIVCYNNFLKRFLIAQADFCEWRKWVMEV